MVSVQDRRLIEELRRRGRLPAQAATPPAGVPPRPEEHSSPTADLVLRNRQLNDAARLGAAPRPSPPPLEDPYEPAFPIPPDAAQAAMEVRRQREAIRERSGQVEAASLRQSERDAEAALRRSNLQRRQISRRSQDAARDRSRLDALSEEAAELAEIETDLQRRALEQRAENRDSDLQALIRGINEGTEAASRRSALQRRQISRRSQDAVRDRGELNDLLEERAAERAATAVPLEDQPSISDVPPNFGGAPQGPSPGPPGAPGRLMLPGAQFPGDRPETNPSALPGQDVIDALNGEMALPGQGYVDERRRRAEEMMSSVIAGEPAPEPRQRTRGGRYVGGPLMRLPSDGAEPDGLRAVDTGAGRGVGVTTDSRDGLRRMRRMEQLRDAPEGGASLSRDALRRLMRSRHLGNREEAEIQDELRRLMNNPAGAVDTRPRRRLRGDQRRRRLSALRPNEPLVEDPGTGQVTEAAAPRRSYDWSEVPGEAARNFPGDAWRIASGRAETLLSPLDTIRGSVGLTAGLINHIVPGEQPSEDYVRAAAQALHEHYGSVENLKRTIAEHPARVAATLAGFGLLGAPRRLAERVDQMRAEERRRERSTLGNAMVNLIPSFAGLIKDITAPIHSPIETTRSFAELGKGIVALLPGEQGSWEKSRETAEAVGKYFADRYGSREGLRRAFEEDPSGVLADIGGLFTLGSGTALKVGAGVAKAAKGGRLGQRAQEAESAARRAAGASAASGALGSAATRANIRALLVPTPENVGRAGRARADARIARRRSTGGQRAAGSAIRATEAAMRGLGALGRKIDPTVLASRGLAGAAAWGAGRVGAGINRSASWWTGSSPDAMMTAYRSSRDNTVADGSRRAGRDELGTKKAFRQQMRGESPLDTVVNEARDTAQQRREDLSRRFTENLGKDTVDRVSGKIDFRLDDPEIARMSLAVKALEDAGADPDMVNATRRGFDQYLEERKTNIRKDDAEAQRIRAEDGGPDLVRSMLHTDARKLSELNPLDHVLSNIRKVSDETTRALARARNNQRQARKFLETQKAVRDRARERAEYENAQYEAGVESGLPQPELDGMRRSRDEAREALGREERTLRAAERRARRLDASTEKAKKRAEAGGRKKQEARAVLLRHYGIEGERGAVSLKPSTFMSDSDEIRRMESALDKFQNTKEFRTARTNFLRSNPEFANELAQDIQRRRKADNVRAGRSARMTEMNRARAADRTVQSIAAALTPPGRRGQPSAFVVKVARHVAGGGEKGRKALDFAISRGVEHGLLTLDELRDLAKIKAIIRPSLAQRVKVLPAAVKAATATAGALARPISRVIAQSAAGAIAGGSRWAQKGGLRQLGRGFTTIPRELYRGTRAGWRGRAGAAAGAKIGAATSAVKPIPMTTGIGAAGDVLSRLRTGSGPWVSNRTRKQVARDLQNFRRTVVETGGQAGLDVYRKWLQSGLSDGQKRALQAMQARIGGEMDMRPGDRSSLGAAPGPSPITRRETAELKRLANHKVDMERVALAVDESVHRTFQGLEADPTTRRMRADIGSWISEYVRQGESMHNLAAADSLLQRFDNAMSSSTGGMVRSKAKDILTTARNAARDAIAAQSPAVYRKVLDARDAGLQHLRDAESALSLRSGQGAESALRKLISTSSVHAGSSADRRLRRQYIDSIGVPFMNERLAGISLDSVFPTTAGRRWAGGALALGGAVNPAMLALALGTSPRIMGEFMSAAGGLAGSRGARFYKGLYSRQNAKRTRAAGLLERLTEDDPRNTLQLAGILAGQYLLPAIGGTLGLIPKVLGGAAGAADRGTTALLGAPPAR